MVDGEKSIVGGIVQNSAFFLIDKKRIGYPNAIFQAGMFYQLNWRISRLSISQTFIIPKLPKIHVQVEFHVQIVNFGQGHHMNLGNLEYFQLEAWCAAKITVIPILTGCLRPDGGITFLL